jgi:hypothetical protein
MVAYTADAQAAAPALGSFAAGLADGRRRDPGRDCSPDIPDS